jgi:beta-lactam-binding protein with PASTA domain
MRLKPIFRTLIKIILTTVALIAGFVMLINIYTNHSMSVDVPNVIGKSFKEGKNILSNNNVDYIVVDSMYDPKIPALTILDQSPKKGNEVKPGRKIYLTLNATTAPTIKLPNIIDNSKRQAKMVLESWGLIVGKETFAPDIAKDAVLSMRINGREVKAGIQIPKGTIVDLVLGDGFGDMDVEVPDLIGLTLMEAVTVLQAINLAPGQITSEIAITDSLNAYVYYQNPEYGSNIHLAPGDMINLYITNEIPTNIVEPSLVEDPTVEKKEEEL